MSFNMNKLVCPDCGGVDIGANAVVNPNTLEFIRFLPSEASGWCNNCDEYKTFITQDEFISGNMRDLYEEESEIIEHTFNRSIKDEPTKL